jgi:hypothetical protein
MLVGVYARKEKTSQHTSVFILLDIMSLHVPLKACLAKSLARPCAAFEERELIMFAQVQNVVQEELLLPTTVIFSEIVGGLKSLRKKYICRNEQHQLCNLYSKLKRIKKNNIQAYLNQMELPLQNFSLHQIFFCMANLFVEGRKSFFLHFPKCLINDTS